MRELVSFAWRNVWRNWQRTMITAFAIGLGLALFIIGFAYIKGFLTFALEATTKAWTGEAQVHDSRYAETQQAEFTLSGGAELVETASKLPGVAAATPRVYGPGMATMGDRTARVDLVGIDLERERRVTNLESKLSRGAWPSEPHHVLIGVKLAEALELSVGDKLVLTAADVESGALNSHLARISGLLYSSNAYVDRQAALVPLPAARQLLGLQQGVHEIALDLRVPADEQAAIAAVLRPLEGPGRTVRPWQEVQRALASALDLNNKIMWLSVLVVFLIAAFGIVNTMTMSFLERYREFGILRAIGTRPRRLMALILVEAACLGAIGVLIGNVLGLLFYWPLSIYGITIGGVEGYGISFDRTILFEFDVAAVVLVSAVFWLLTVLTALGTARRAALVEPMKALRQI